MATPNVAADTWTLWGSLPPFVQDADAANGYLFLLWLDGMGSQLQTLDDLCRDQGQVPGWSILLDVSRCPTYALPYLGQFIGVRFSGNPTDAQMRATLLNPPGWNRGTVSSLATAAAPYLLPGYSIEVLERTPDPYSVTINVPSDGVVGYTYAEIDALYTPYSTLDDEFATYADWTTNTTAMTAALLGALPAGIVGTVNYI